MLAADRQNVYKTFSLFSERNAVVSMDFWHNTKFHRIEENEYVSSILRPEWERPDKLPGNVYTKEIKDRKRNNSDDNVDEMTT